MTIGPAPIVVLGRLDDRGERAVGREGRVEQVLRRVARDVALALEVDVGHQQAEARPRTGRRRPVSVRTSRGPSQPMSITTRAVASRPLPSPFMTNMYGTKLEGRGAGRAARRCRRDSEEIDRGDLRAARGDLGDHSMPPRWQLVGDAPALAVEHVGEGGVDDRQPRPVGAGGHPRVQRPPRLAVGRQPVLAAAVRRGLADVRPAAVHQRVGRRGRGAGGEDGDGDRGDGCEPGDHRASVPRSRRVEPVECDGLYVTVGPPTAARAPSPDPRSRAGCSRRTPCRSATWPACRSSGSWSRRPTRRSPPAGRRRWEPRRHRA